MTTRRVLALLLILAAGLVRYETVWGEVRDGAIHHESAAVAAEHSATSKGDHGHEDRGTTEHRHDEQHQHGTSADHCTHQHSVGLPASVDFDLGEAMALRSAAVSYRSTAGPPSGLFHPPRA